MTMTAVTTFEALSADQPPALVVPDALQLIASATAGAGKVVVVLDDDPTGSQVVHDLPVLTGWDDADLRWALTHPGGGVFILTNTRSLGGAATRSLVEDLDDRVHRIGDEVGVDVVVISRSDSTLRGHFPLETDVLAEGARRRGRPYDATLLVPAYLDAGRVTVDDIHYARTPEGFVPVGGTDYATDDAFGYSSSSLPDWVVEKVGAPTRVGSLSLRDIRVGGVARVTELLLGSRDGTVVVVNALEEADLEVVALGLAAAEATGWRALCRTGPSFVPVRVGMPRRPPLHHHEVFGGHPRAGHGLVVVGSHVELTTRQVERLRELPDLTTVELAVSALTSADGARAEIERCRDALLAGSARGDVLLVTSRQRIVLRAGESSLEFSQRVSSALVELTQGLVGAVELAWVIGKGGITSHDIAMHGLGIRRALVLGQLFPGIVSVWRNEPATDAATDDAIDDAAERPASPGPLSGLPYVVFAGNVGDETTLRDAVLTLRGSMRA